MLLLLFDLSQQATGRERDKTDWPDLPNMEHLFSGCCCLQFADTDVDLQQEAKRQDGLLCCG